MQPNSNPTNSQTSISSVQDFLASLFQSLANGEDSKIQEAQSFLKLHESQGLKSLDFFFLKTLEGFSITKTGLHSKSFSKPWKSWGMIQNGMCLTANFSFHKTGRGYSLSDILEEEVPEKYYLSEKYVDYLMRHTPTHIFPALLQRTTKDQASNESPTQLLKIGNIAKSGHDSLWGRVYDPKGISANLNAEGGGLGAKTGLYLMSHTKANIKQRYQQRDETWTLDTSGNKMGVEEFKDKYRIRKLTPRECERLQGFPDGWTVGQSDTQRYKQLGNAVTVDVVEYIGKSL